MSTESSAAQVEKVLEDLIARLSKSPGTSDTKAVLIEARRLRNVTMRWSAIPPQPDARSEMMARVMDLVTQVGLNARDLRGTEPPKRASVAPAAASTARAAAPSRPPPPLAKPTAPPPPPRNRLSGAQDAPMAPPPPSPKPPAGDLKAGFRQFDGLGQTRPKPLRTDASSKPAAPKLSAPPSVPVSQKPTVPPAVPAIFGAKVTAERSLSPWPEPPPLERPRSDAQRPAAFPDRSISPLTLQAQRSVGNRSLSPSPMWRVSPTNSKVSKVEPPLATHVSATMPAVADEPRHASPTLEIDVEGRPGDEWDGPPSKSKPTLPPLPPKSTPSTPRLGGSAPPPLRNRSPHRAATIAGIPEANEAMIAAAIAGRPLAAHSDDEDTFEAAAKRSSLPTLPPAGPSSAPPPPKRPAKETLMMGALGAVEALAAVGAAKSPALPSDFDDFDKPPSTKPSNPPESPAALGIATPNRGSSERIEGLSTKISRTDLTPVQLSRRSTQRPPASAPSLAPASTRASLRPAEGARIGVGAGITLVKPSTAGWQPHPKFASVSQKLLHRDPRSGLFTALLRLSPGALLPSRRHVAIEEIYVVSGVVTLDGHDCEAGDYLRAEADTVHPSMTTKNGCTLFVVSSDHDEVLED
jgi:hypothetical protein